MNNSTLDLLAFHDKMEWYRFNDGPYEGRFHGEWKERKMYVPSLVNGKYFDAHVMAYRAELCS